MAEMKDSTKKKLTAIGAGAATAAGLYAGLRGHGGKLVNKVFNRTRPKGTPTWLYEGTKINDPWTKFKAWAGMGDFKLLSTSEARKAGPIKGQVFYEGEQKALKGIKFERKSDTWNTDKKVIEGIFQDKLRFGKLKHKDISPTTTIKAFTKDKAHATPLGLAKQIAKHKGDWYIKPRRGFGSAGYDYNFSSGELQRAVAKGKVPRTFEKVHAEPDKFIIQRKFDLEIHPRKQKPTTEHRVNIAIDNGQASHVGVPIRRWLLMNGIGKNYVSGKQTAKIVQETIDKNPSLQKALKGKKFVFGADVAREKSTSLLRGGKHKLIEMNDQSGFFHYPQSGHAIYRKMTGADSRPVAALKGVAAGAAVGTGTYIGQKKMTKKAEAVFEKIAISTRTLLDATHATAGKIKRLAGEAAKPLGGQGISQPARKARELDRAIAQRQNIQAYLTERPYKEAVKYPAGHGSPKAHVQALSGISDEEAKLLIKQRQVVTRKLR